MVRERKNLEAENEKLEQLIKKKKEEIHKIEEKIRRNTNLQTKKRATQDRTVSVHIQDCTDRLTTIRVIDTGEIHQYWGYSTPNTYTKITNQFLEELRDCKQKYGK